MTAVTAKGGSCFTTTTDTLVYTKPRFKVGLVTTVATTTSSDTTTVSLWDDFGIRTLLGVTAWQHLTENSVIENEDSADTVSTTAVDGQTLTITINGTSDQSKRVYAVYGL